MLTFPPIPTYIFFCPGYFTSFEEESRFHAADLQKAKRVKMFLCVFVVDRVVTEKAVRFSTLFATLSF